MKRLLIVPFLCFLTLGAFLMKGKEIEYKAINLVIENMEKA